MNNLDKIAELFNTMYEEKYCGVELEGRDKVDESFKKLCGMLNKEQSKALHEYDLEDFDFMISLRKHVIKFMLELLCPEGESFFVLNFNFYKHSSYGRFIFVNSYIFDYTLHFPYQNSVAGDF